MIKLFKTVAESNLFQNFITGVILFAGALVGLETYPSFHERYEPVLHVLDQVVLWIFVGEIIIKMVAELPRPWRYFYDGWNVFDFLIVAGAFLPFAAQYATVLRLLRLLRVLKLVRALPKLQMLVGALLKSIPSMAYVSLLLMMLFYVYAVAATFMWGHNDPVHFGNLQMSFLSLFRALRYARLVDEFAAEPATTRRAYLILSVFRSDMRALTRYLGQQAAEHMSDAFERQLLAVPASELPLHRDALARDASELLRFRRTLESVANMLNVEIRKIFERELPALHEPAIY